MVDGFYVLDKNFHMISIDYLDQLMQNAVLMIRGKRNAFYPDKNFGSDIKNHLDNEREVLAYARQAVADLDGVCVKSASINMDGITFCLLVNDEERSVVVSND